jgi:uncharacterized protein (DUF2236 family)
MVEQPLSHTAFEARLDRVLAEVDEPRVGLFGPESIVWEVFRHTHVYLLGTVLSGFLDTAHPWVARAIVQHSRLFEDPRKRGEQTYMMLTRVVFGDAATVRKVSRYLFTLHGGVEGQLEAPAGRFPAGSDYAANEVSALTWVYLVGFWTRLKVYESSVGTLTDQQRDQFARESGRFAACFGVPEDRVPQDHAAFQTAFDEIASSDQLAFSVEGRRIVEFLFSQVPAAGRPSLRAFVRSTLPGPVLDALELPRPGRITSARGRVLLLGMRASGTLAPRGARFLPAYHEAMQRITGAPAPRMSARVNRAIMGRATVT